MTDPATIVGLQTAWRRSGLLVFVGTLVALIAFVTTAHEAAKNAELAMAEAKRAQLERILADRQRDDLKRQISELRTALTASRSAIAAFHQQDYASALKFYDEALAADPDDAYLLNLRAYTLFKQRRYDEALSEELRSVRADPNYAWGYFDLARFQCALGKRDDARESIAKALSLNPDLRDKMRGDGEFRRLCGDIVP